MVRLLVAALVLAEIASIVLVGQRLGILSTLLLVVLAALLGGAILRRQGGDALRGMRGALQEGRDPRASLLRGGFRVAAALLLILPGFLSDLVALLLLLPPVQRALTQGVARKGLRVAKGSRGGPQVARSHAAPATGREVDEAEWEEVAPPRSPAGRPSGWTRH